MPAQFAEPLFTEHRRAEDFQRSAEIADDRNRHKNASRVRFNATIAAKDSVARSDYSSTTMLYTESREINPIPLKAPVLRVKPTGLAGADGKEVARTKGGRPQPPVWKEATLD
tara:strand:- start:272 stop:610 length:339 start_codon:yes stop_codon:yes gene_type:complete